MNTISYQLIVTSSDKRKPKHLFVSAFLMIGFY